MYDTQPVSVEFDFVRLSKNVWVNPQMVVSITDTPAAPGSSVDHECTVYMLDDRAQTIYDQTAEAVVLRLVNHQNWCADDE